jgi:hypothetical protein
MFATGIRHVAPAWKHVDPDAPSRASHDCLGAMPNSFSRGGTGLSFTSSQPRKVGLSLGDHRPRSHRTIVVPTQGWRRKKRTECHRFERSNPIDSRSRCNFRRIHSEIGVQMPPDAPSWGINDSRIEARGEPPQSRSIRIECGASARFACRCRRDLPVTFHPLFGRDVQVPRPRCLAALKAPRIGVRLAVRPGEGEAPRPRFAPGCCGAGPALGRAENGWFAVRA